MYPISRSRHHFYYCDPKFNMVGWFLLFGKPPFLFCQLGHNNIFPAQYFWYYCSLFLIPPFSLLHICSDVLIFCFYHHTAYIFFSVVLPLWNISEYDVSIAPCIHLRIRCHIYNQSLVSHVYASTFLVNLCLHCCFHMPNFPSSLISASLFYYSSSFISTAPPHTTTS